MKILVDMNLSPDWLAVFAAEGWEAAHWSSVGDPRAKDSDILEWAKENEHLIFTHDLDFGTMLFAKRDCAPSVIQLRTQETSPAEMSALVVRAIRQLKDDLDRGALVTIDPNRARARILPLG